MYFKQSLIFLNIILLLLQPATCSSAITCSAGVATMGGPATVTCNFNRDIKSTQTSFVIWKFPIKSADLHDSTYRKDVLNCNWVKDKPVCVTADGYTFEGHTVGTTASVDIPIATTDQEGIYKCQLATQEIIKISTCNLTMEAREGNQVSQGISSFISSLTPTGAFILIVGLFLVSLFFIFVTTFLYRKYTCPPRADKPRADKFDQEVQTSTVELGDRGTNTSLQNCAEFGTNTEPLLGQQPVPTVLIGNPNGWVSNKDDKKGLSKPQNGHNPYTHNEGISSLSKQPPKSQSMQTLSTNHDEEEQRHQPFLQTKLYPQLPPEEPLNMNPAMKYPSNSDVQSNLSFDRESYEEEVGSYAADSSKRLGEIDSVSGYNYQGQIDHDTTQDDNGKGPEKEKKGRMRKVLSLLTKK